jgi:uncharacterized membrane protein
MSEAGRASNAEVMRDSRDERIEQVIGRLLQFGVLLAAVVVLIGGAMLLAQYGGNPASFAKFSGEDPLLKSIGSILHGVATGSSRAIVQLGLVLLVATPVARVALTLGAFLLQRDRLYVVVTTTVLVLLLYGLIWGRA